MHTAAWWAKQDEEWRCVEVAGVATRLFGISDWQHPRTSDVVAGLLRGGGTRAVALGGGVPGCVNFAYDRAAGRLDVTWGGPPGWFKAANVVRLERHRPTAKYRWRLTACAAWAADLVSAARFAAPTGGRGRDVEWDGQPVSVATLHVVAEALDCYHGLRGLLADWPGGVPYGVVADHLAAGGRPTDAAVLHLLVALNVI